ncbi:MAG TPA: glutathione S-transferase family protein [Labilithrix sp.]|jgi:glutathione S-transferase
MKLYEFGPTRSIRARWTLQELGVPFEAVTVDLFSGEHKKPEYLAVNPAGKLPALVDGDFVLTESVAIVLYLADKYPEKRLLPEDPKGRAEATKWLLFTATELEQPLWRISKHTALYPTDKRIPAEIENAKGDFRAMACVMEKHLAGRDFVVGDAVTVADFVLAYTLDWANEVKLLEGTPNLVRYFTSMYARPHAAPRIAQAFSAVRNR